MTIVSAGIPTEELERLDAWWRAANYLSVGQIYLMANPLLREPLAPEHVKPRLLGHWGTTPGLNLVYAHASRVIKARDLDAIWIVGPGHGGPAAVAAAYLEGTAAEVDPGLTFDEDGPALPVPTLLVPRRDRQPRHARDPGLHPRGRRARLRARPRLRGRVRQPGPGGVLRRRRRRGGDRPARRQLAFEQVPRPGGRWDRRPDPGAQRLQDRQPDDPRPDPGAGADQPVRGVWLPARTSSPATTR